jgi:hypothetical protein
MDFWGFCGHFEPKMDVIGAFLSFLEGFVKKKKKS